MNRLMCSSLIVKFAETMITTTTATARTVYRIWKRFILGLPNEREKKKSHTPNSLRNNCVVLPRFLAKNPTK